VRLGAGAPPIGIPFFWPLAAMPNIVMDEWSDMVFLKPNGASFSAVEYPKLAKVWPGLVIPEMRGEFLRIWDDGRGVDAGRAILSAQGDAIREITGKIYSRGGTATSSGAIAIASGAFSYEGAISGDTSSTLTTTSSPAKQLEATTFSVAASGLPTANENRPRNIAFNFLVRAK
ncbi:phage tail protein, partial [Escherichia coli]|nr:phage tail protein [Escherichia coli]